VVGHDGAEPRVEGLGSAYRVTRGDDGGLAVAVRRAT